MATSSDVITNSLPNLSKLKQFHEQELKSQIKIATAKKAELQECVEKLAGVSQNHAFLVDSRRLIVDRSWEFLAQAAKLEADNKTCQVKVESLDRQMLKVREVQRASEGDYSARMDELRVKITGAKGNYSPGVLEQRGRELRGDKCGLLERCIQLEEDLKEEEDEDDSGNMN